jgi:hypothetical protein
MKTTISLLAALVTGAALVWGCGDDPADDKPTGSDGTGASADPTSTGSGAGSGTGASGAGGSAPTRCSTDEKPLEPLTGNITADTTLSADKEYVLQGIVQVKSGATLTVEPCTTIRGDKATLGTLVIEPGAKIHAEGEVDRPIVFTSLAEKGDRAAGDWGGVILLGRAPINVPGGVANVEGITGDGTSYGGDDPDDDSGVLKYVRIEFSGILLSPDNEVNGLTLAGVGAGTTIDYVMVHNTLDDCFEFFGGTVNAKHLICAYNGDDGIDWDYGYRGKLQFVAVQQDPSVADDTNGFEGDNDADGSDNSPRSEPTIYNATLCGKNVDVDKQQYGMLLRRSTRAHLFNIVATGFEAGVDVRDALTTVELKSSIFFGNLVHNVAYPEQGGSDIDIDDDDGFDELSWFTARANKNAAIDPKIRACFTPGAPDFRPATTLTENAATPPDDGFFDPSAKYIGAFKADDEWAVGAWVSFDLN